MNWLLYKTNNANRKFYWKIYEEDKQNEVNKEEKKEIIERQYDENGNPIVDYKLTNEGDAIVEGILDILPDGYGFLRGDNFLSMR